MLTEENLPPLKILEGSIVDTPDSALMPRYKVFRDSILLVKEDKPIGKFLKFFNLNTGELIAQYFNKGDGPNDLLSPIVYTNNSDDNISILDVATSANFVMNMDSILMHGDDYIPHRITITDFIKSISWMGDSLAIASNGLYLEGHNDPEDIPEFIKYDGKTGKRQGDNSVVNKINCSYVGGSKIYSNSEKKIIFAGYRAPRAAFYDLNFNLIKEFIGPENDDLEYEEVAELGGLFYKDLLNCEFYGNGTCDDKYIFIINVHQYKQPEYKGNSNKIISEATDIYIFSWDCELVARIKSKETYRIISLSYCNESKSLYITGEDMDGDRNRNLIRFDLAKILK
ncbi:MAG: hypothetical protein K6G73_00860 [Marinilabiliaceae bacterium]|nr:hypothetical protein [Marinilabiliaceae bacterium]